MDQKYFPSEVLEYKFAEVNGNQGLLGSIYNMQGVKGDNNAELVMTLRSFDKFIDSDSGSFTAENIRNQDLLKRAIRHDISEGELGELRKAMGKVFIELGEIYGLPILVWSYAGAEPASTNVLYLDKSSNIVFTLGFVEENLNYQPYFVDWAKKAC